MSHLKCRRMLSLCDNIAGAIRDVRYDDEPQTLYLHCACAFGSLLWLSATTVYIAFLIVNRPETVVNIISPTWDSFVAYNGSRFQCSCQHHGTYNTSELLPQSHCSVPSAQLPQDPWLSTVLWVLSRRASPLRGRCRRALLPCTGPLRSGRVHILCFRPTLTRRHGTRRGRT